MSFCQNRSLYIGHLASRGRQLFYTRKGALHLSTNDPRQPSHRLTFDEAVQIWLAVWRGEYKNRIAARYDVNVWRIYEVISGKLHPGSEAVARSLWQEPAA
jgi:hypothetical protein